MGAFFSFIGVLVFLAACVYVVDQKRKAEGKDGLIEKFKRTKREK